MAKDTIDSPITINVADVVENVYNDSDKIAVATAGGTTTIDGDLTTYTTSTNVSINLGTPHLISYARFKYTVNSGYTPRFYASSSETSDVSSVSWVEVTDDCTIANGFITWTPTDPKLVQWYKITIGRIYA